MTPATTDLPVIHGKGVAPVRIPAVDKLVDAYVTARDRRMEKTTLEVEAKDALIDALHDNADKLTKNKDGELIYRHDDLIVTLTAGKEKLKVRTEELEPPEK